MLAVGPADAERPVGRQLDKIAANGRRKVTAPNAVGPVAGESQPDKEPELVGLIYGDIDIPELPLLIVPRFAANFPYYQS